VLSQLSVHAFLELEAFDQELSPLLQNERYGLNCYQSELEFLERVQPGEHQPDCLVLQEGSRLSYLIDRLIAQEVILPTVILVPEILSRPEDSTLPTCHYYHPAEVLVAKSKLHQLDSAVEQAIANFLQLSPLTSSAPPETALSPVEQLDKRYLLIEQQQRLSEKLKERLGYLGVYYKRDPDQFLRYLPPPEAQELLDSLRSLYRTLVLNYFGDEENLNALIDEFVNLAFFADVSVTTIVEMHMELMDEFAKQLKLEGRSEDVLLDYRLTLIDTIAHLCEMYRRSIPREA
jgi:circadian clock protein KaiA